MVGFVLKGGKYSRDIYLRKIESKCNAKPLVEKEFRSFLSVYIKCVCLPYILIVIVLYDTYMQYDIKLHINVMWGGRQVFVYSNYPTELHCALMDPTLLFYFVYNNNDKIKCQTILLVKRKSAGA